MWWMVGGVRPYRWQSVLVFWWCQAVLEIMESIEQHKWTCRVNIAVCLLLSPQRGFGFHHAVNKDWLVLQTLLQDSLDSILRRLLGVSCDGGAELAGQGRFLRRPLGGDVCNLSQRRVREQDVLGYVQNAVWNSLSPNTFFMVNFKLSEFFLCPCFVLLCKDRSELATNAGCPASYFLVKNSYFFDLSYHLLFG